VHGADSAHDDVALRADVGKAFEGFSLWQGKRVSGGFAGDSEVGAGGLPFEAVGGDTPSAVAFFGDEVGEFVKDDTANLFLGDVGLEEFGIEGDERFFWGGEACGAPESCRPFHFDPACEVVQAKRAGCGTDV
jgi:hypothetical protein